MTKKTIKISSEFIKLDSLLKLIGEAATGGQAKIMILDGEVYVNDEVCLQRGKKIKIGDVIKTEKNEYSIEAI